MKVKILDVNVEHVVKGKSRYSKATVAYSYNGEARTQNIMSFSNPDVFAKVQEKVGQEVEVTVTKNDAGYNQWSALGEVGSAPAAAANTATAGTGGATRVSGSNYETSAERAARQVYIIKQSSLGHAIELIVANKEKATPEDIVKTAQFFVDWVMGNDNSLEGLQSDTL